MDLKNKLSKEIVNERLMVNGRDVQLIGEYINAKTKSLFGCNHGHTWWAIPNSVVMNGKGCPHCSLVKSTKTKEIVNLQIEKRGIRIIGEYINANTKTKFECLNDHTWEAIPNNVINHQSGCPHCLVENPRLSASQRELFKRQLNVDIAHRNIQMVGEYTNAKTKTEFRCQCGHMWQARPDNVSGGRGCPVCADYGFNPNQPAWEYGFTRDGYLKYGITNDLTRRLNEHRRHGEITLVHERYHEVGRFALDWEANIKQTYGGRYATKEQCPDGYTETLCLSKLKAIVGLSNDYQRSESEII